MSYIKYVTLMYIFIRKILSSQLTTSLKLCASLFCSEDVKVSFTLMLTCYCFLRDSFLHSLNCAERGLCSLYSLPQV